MDPMLRFRRDLARRVLRAMAAAAAVAGGSSQVAACSSPTSSGAAGDYMTTECFVWPLTGGTGGAGGASGAGGAGDTTCPSQSAALSHFGGCGVTSVDGPGAYANGQCCYPVTEPGCLTGRPFLVQDRPRAAPVRRSPAKGWSRAASPSVAGLSSRARAALAEAWASDARGEHASVASFARFTLDLIAVGAPAELLAAAQRAALDEVRHAELCFALASAYGGAPLSPGPFPFGGSVAVAGDLATLAASAVKEGCVGETLAAIQASAQRDAATDPAVRAALTTIAADEARHAELAWRTVAWAVAEGGAEVLRAVRAAFDEALAAPPIPEPIAADLVTELAAHGRLDGPTLTRAFERAIAEVIRPAMRSLESAS